MTSEAAQAVAPSWYTLDRQWTIVDCDPDLPIHLSGSIGRRIWDASPGIEDRVRPVFEDAWQTGRADAVLEIGDIIADLHVIRRDDKLFVSFRYVTVRNLRETLASIAAGLDQRESPERAGRTPGARSRAGLRLIVSALCG